MKKIIAAICASFMMIGPGIAVAAKTANATIPVRAQVVGNCTVSTSGSLDFGTYDGSTKKDVNTTLTVSCTQQRTGITVDIGSANSFAMKGALASNSDTLPYTIYSTDPTLAGGGTTWGTYTLPTVTKGGTQSVTVFGEIASGLPASDDTYTDTLTVTVAY